MYILLTFIPIAVLLVGFALAGYYLIHLIHQDILDRQESRYKKRTTFSYDPNGNPQWYYDAATERLIIPPSGNSPFSPTILIRDSTQRNVKPDKEQAILYNIPEKTQSHYDGKTIEEITNEVLNPEISIEPKLPVSEGETRLYIENCIEKGIGKLKAARAIGIQPGDNKPYKAFTALWDAAVASKNNDNYLS